MPATPLAVEQHEGVCWLRLNRPHRRNALEPQLIARLNEEISHAIDDQDIAVVVIAGNGRSFCAGADLRYLLGHAHAGGDPVPFLTEVSRCFDRIEQCPKPVIAAVHGHVVAGGLELALACDIVIAEAGTLIGDGHVRNGLLPGGGASTRLPRKAGEPLARWLMLSGTLMPAEKLATHGLVHDIAPPGRLSQRAAHLAGQLIHPPARQAQAGVKGLLHQWNDEHDSQQRELKAFARHWRNSDIRPTLERFVYGRRGE
ncbi:enoyl-CoA hydratase/isomerase family protein [Prauserella shujinwangii]|uniref:enoyl-CoA hydratase/isomerase family protein n=1 Tax=Prauserella shujinwangii TaxID=1453103 RepID=UPI000D07B810|nr:enoyl-CoA hydratase/isomerase family protein [Prauserella shujinwangii]